MVPSLSRSVEKSSMIMGYLDERASSFLSSRDEMVCSHDVFGSANGSCSLLDRREWLISI